MKFLLDTVSSFFSKVKEKSPEVANEPKVIAILEAEKPAVNVAPELVNPLANLVPEQPKVDQVKVQAKVDPKTDQSILAAVAAFVATNMIANNMISSGVAGYASGTVGPFLAGALGATVAAGAAPVVAYGVGTAAYHYALPAAKFTHENVLQPTYSYVVKPGFAFMWNQLAAFTSSFLETAYDHQVKQNAAVDKENFGIEEFKKPKVDVSSSFFDSVASF